MILPQAQRHHGRTYHSFPFPKSYTSSTNTVLFASCYLLRSPQCVHFTMADHEPLVPDEKVSSSANLVTGPATRSNDHGPSENNLAVDKWLFIPSEVIVALRKIAAVSLLLAVFFVLIDPDDSTTPQPFKQQTPHISWNYPRLESGARTARPWVQLTSRQAPPAGGNATTPPLQTFSVDVPLLGLDGTVVGAGTPAGFEGIETSLGDVGAVAGCQVTLGVNVFANSFGAPFVGNYTPPACIGDSNTVVMNLTVKSQGRQFDRLAIM